MRRVVAAEARAAAADERAAAEERLTCRAWLEAEEESQNAMLKDALERRRKGKDKLKNIVSSLAEKKDIKDKEY